jgi:aldehyde dehydrogenase (NAD+)
MRARIPAMSPFATGNPVSPTLLDTPATSAGAFVGSQPILTPGPALQSRSPIDGELIANTQTATPDDLPSLITSAGQAFAKWRLIPPPVRGDLLRLIAIELRRHRSDLASLITLEVGKTLAEAGGEVQQVIETFEFAAGLSRQLAGASLASQTPSQRILEQYHPLGPIAIITSFNFPIAVYAWNAAMAILCGDSVIWKPSEKASLCAVAFHHLLAQAISQFPGAPGALLILVRGGKDLAQSLAASQSIPLVCATGSFAMGRSIAAAAAQRLGRTLLELGGNNAAILTPSADRPKALKAIVHSATATAGQRCTSLRRIIVHQSIKQQVLDQLHSLYCRQRIGDPRLQSTEIGPLIDQPAVDAFHHAVEQARREGGHVLCGNGASSAPLPRTGHYVQPALIDIEPDAPIVQNETFGPLLYVHGYEGLDEAIAINNAVPQGLSSTIFTTDLREAEHFIATSDCGQAHVNLPTVGLEIGAAFGGEKQSGSGREFSADAWKCYMRRSTSIISA